MFVAARSFSGEVRVWECETVLDGDAHAQVLDDSWIGRAATGEVYGVAFAPNGDYLASGNQAGSVDIWIAPGSEHAARRSRQESRHLQRYASLDAGHESVNGVAWCPDGLILLTGHHNGKLIMWRPAGNSWEPETFGGHTSEVTNVAWSPGGLYFVSAAFDQSVRLWHRRHLHHNIASHHKHIQGVNSVAWSSAGLVASVDLAGSVLVWRPLANPEEALRPLQGHAECVSCVDFSWDGKLMATKSIDGTVKLWSTIDWTVVHCLSEIGDSGWGSVAFHPSMPLLATLGDDEQQVRVWEFA